MAALICKEQGIDLVLVKAQSEVHAKVLYKMGVDRGVPSGIWASAWRTT